MFGKCFRQTVVVQNLLRTGFTLVELLVALAILGIIAAFTIPKILTLSTDEQSNAKAKEAIQMVAGAFQQMQANGIISANTTGTDLFNYMNYVTVDTSTVFDNTYTNATTLTCQVTAPCIRLHNGALLYSASATSFGGTATTNILWYNFDPDAMATSASTTDGPGKSLKFGIYYNGKVITRDDVLPGTKGGATTYATPSPLVTPPWFHW